MWKLLHFYTFSWNSSWPNRKSDSSQGNKTILMKPMIAKMYCLGPIDSSQPMIPCLDVLCFPDGNEQPGCLLSLLFFSFLFFFFQFFCIDNFLLCTVVHQEPIYASMQSAQGATSEMLLMRRRMKFILYISLEGFQGL